MKGIINEGKNELTKNRSRKRENNDLDLILINLQRNPFFISVFFLFSRVKYYSELP